MFKFFLVIITCLVLTTSCTEKHFITDFEIREEVQKRFDYKVKYAENRKDKLFSVFSKNISLEEKEALKYLYAYMPLNDLADYDGKFFLSQVKTVFEARKTFRWGAKIPEEIFRHFVLPYRINNENLDSARIVFFKELKPRLINLTLKEAILEVNHWCHEKVAYKPTDIRTSAPLSTVRTSWGRCGEESTFTVTALRAVGIPARQVYTPRWAHCDDNHAWVEVWIEGDWYYLGACEPEGDLNIAWFTEPVKRAMMVHTKVFGDYDTDEEILKKTDNYTTISTLSNYTKVKKIVVDVRDENNEVVENAVVDFGIYNYAEFFPIASKKTKHNGLTCLKTGFGDLIISANYNGKFGFKKVSVELTDTIKIILEKNKPGNKKISLDIIPPIIKAPTKFDEILVKQNQIRLKEEDKIRNEYMNTFISKEKSKLFAKEMNLDEERISKILDKSEGNWRNIKSLINEAVNNQIKPSKIYGLLENISDKDLRDSEKYILDDHLYNSKKNKLVSESVFNKYVLNPRIKNEMLTAYKKSLNKEFSNSKPLINKIEDIKQYILSNIKIDNEQNYYDLPITPLGVDELKITNEESRDIYFVAICRSLGIPARLEETEKIPQYFNNKNWISVNFQTFQLDETNFGYLHLINANTAFKIEPQYFIHFTIGKFENGVYKTLEYEWEKRLKDFPNKIKLQVGKYRVITGNRKENGSVLSNITYFEIEKNKTKNINISLRNDSTPDKILGKINLKRNKLGKHILSELFNKDYLIVGWIDPDKEPTKHFLADLKTLKEEFQSWNGNLTLIIPENKVTDSFSQNTEVDLPSNLKFELDYDELVYKTFLSELNLNEKISYPLITLINKKGEIVFKSTGYRIGLGEQLLKIVL